MTTLVARVSTGLLVLALVAGAFLYVRDGARVIVFPFPMDYGEGPLLAQTLRLGQGENMGLLVRAGRPIYLQPFEMTQLARARRWDQGPLLGDIERQVFAAILIYAIPEVPLHRQRWTDEMLDAIGRRYEVAERVGQTLVYRPRPGG